jgi:hypothetical protein
MTITSEVKEGTELSFEELDKIKKNVESWYSYWNENLEVYKNDTRFVHGIQLDPSEISSFKKLHKPIFIVNKIYSLIKQVIGDMRKYTPNIAVRDELGTHEQKEVDLVCNILRNIAYKSENDIVYQIAGECALKGGYGAWRILTDYTSPKSFDLDIKLESIVDPTICFWDSNATKPSKEDGQYCGMYEMIDEDVFKERYPDVDPNNSALNVFPTQTSNAFSWVENRGSKKVVAVVEYFKKEPYEKELLLLSNGATLEARDYDEYVKEFEKQARAMGRPQKLEIVDRRKTEDYNIIHYKLCGSQILAKTTWPGKYLPIIYLCGDRYFDEGKEYTISFGRYVQDLQKYLNYLQSDLAHGIMLARREQYLGTPENVKTREVQEIWRDPANVQGMLLAHRDSAGQMPVRQPPPEISQTEVMQYNITDQQIRSTLGMFQPVMGEGGTVAESGVAIAKRIQQSNTTNYIYFDNLKRAIAHGAKVIMDLIPEVYTNDRYVKATDKEGNTTIERVNYQDEQTGKMVNYLGVRDYALEVKAGSPFLLQKQEAFQQMMGLVQASPQVFPLIADLLAKNLDLENAGQIADRLKTIVPPEIMAKETGKPLPPQPPNPAQIQSQAMMTRAQADMMKAQADMVEAKKQGSLDLVKTQMKSKAEMAKAMMDYNKHMMTLSNDQEKAQLEQENRLLKYMVQV